MIIILSFFYAIDRLKLKVWSATQDLFGFLIPEFTGLKCRLLDWIFYYIVLIRSQKFIFVWENLSSFHRRMAHF
ncbi:hypothetical protein C4X99_20430 [Leptospira interrogans serovar Geyaweera]|uniref:hypothetical protein n=1 Tax=Leptospira interrogans TaxID=173 RepID=UPI0010C0835B|nr:hypothetical protein C4X99_20430 [Leptospira interrogans serovar Geyaweera]QCO37359.1 hypothetical protein E4412_09175 [Leptospira interrogans]